MGRKRMDIITDRLRNKVKAAIKKGGIVLAPMRSGKTHTLAEIVLSDRNACIVTMNLAWRDVIVDTCYGLDPKRAEKTKVCDRVFGYKPGLNRRLIDERRKVYVDEYLWGLKAGYYRDLDFFAAVSSPIAPIQVIKPSRKEANRIKRHFRRGPHSAKSVKRDFCLF